MVKDKPFDNDAYPLHAQVSAVPVRTPIDVRLGLTLLPARYILRAFSKTLTDSGTPDIFRKYTTIPIRDHLFAEPLFKKVNARLAQTPAQTLIPGAIPEHVDEITKALRGTIEHPNLPAQALKEDLRVLLQPFDAKDQVNNLLEYSIRHRDPKTGLLTLTDESKNRIKSRLSEPLFEFLYDNALGVGSFWMAYTIRQRVLTDMKSIYSEAVAYELNKDPSQITEQDIFDSKNTIVHSTVQNFNTKQNQRFGISFLPFLKNVPAIRASQFGDLAIGAWGLLWAFDVWGREPTMLEMLSDFVNDRLNLKFGFGDKIKPTDIINIYQQYALKFYPEKSFRSLISRDPVEQQLWAANETVFSRIAELMNDSYNYKHTAVLDPMTGAPIASADFTLPKFIYLLGHDLINTREPEWTKAYIEIANKYGMEAVKETAKAQKSGKPLGDVLAKYPVTIDHALSFAKAETLSQLSATPSEPAAMADPAPISKTFAAAPTHQVSHPHIEQVGIKSTHHTQHTAPQLAI